ncbi:hypothetical protein KJ951_02935, partial [Patescibacteria group bacterium]|nr:hypothetical protein [Patescibacteria group bacterium]MBU1954402.1 hypothetical protein [Patescibacteria group bacterium]
MADNTPIDLKIEAKPATAAPKLPESDAPSAIKPAVAPALETKPAEGPAFTNIFNRQKEEEKESKVISSVLQKQTPASAAKPILGAAPLLQKSLEDERKIKLQRKLRLVQTVFAIMFIATAAGAFYFFKELSPTFDVFGPNVTQNLKSVNDSLRGVQKNINAYRYKAAQLALNRFSFLSDQFMDETAKVESGGLSTGELQALQQDIEQTANDLPKYLADIKTPLSTSIVVSTVLSKAEPKLTDEEIKQIAENDLREALMSERRAIT